MSNSRNRSVHSGKVLEEKLSSASKMLQLQDCLILGIDVNAHIQVQNVQPSSDYSKSQRPGLDTRGQNGVLRAERAASAHSIPIPSQS